MKAAELKEEAQANLALKSATQKGPLDPLIKGFIDFVEPGELIIRIRKVFERMDVDESGGISLKELNEGLRRLFHASANSCQLTPEDFELVTEHGAFVDENGEMDIDNFEEMVMSQLRKFCLRKVCGAIARAEDDQNQDHFFALKMLLNYTQVRASLSLSTKARQAATSALTPSLRLLSLSLIKIFASASNTGRRKGFALRGNGRRQLAFYHFWGLSLPDRNS